MTKHHLNQLIIKIAIIQHLAEVGMSNNYQFIRLTKLADAAVCQHLDELLQAGLIDETFIGNQHGYFLKDEATAAVTKLKRVIVPVDAQRKRRAAKKMIP